jgi:hypothetical protein
MNRAILKYTGIIVAIVGFVSSIVGIISWMGINLHIGGVYISNPLLALSLLLIMILLSINMVRKPKLCIKHIGKNGLPYYRVMDISGRRHTVQSILKDGHWYKVCTCQDNIPGYWKRTCWHVIVAHDYAYIMKRIAKARSDR